MMKKCFILFIVIIVNFIIQFTLLQHFKIWGVIPNTALIIVVCFAILQGRKDGAIIGFFLGILQDVFVGNVIGANALSYMLVGYCMGNLEKFIFKDNFLNPVFFTAIATIIYSVLFLFILYMIDYPIHIAMLFQSSLLIEIIYNGVLAIFFYKFVLRLMKYLKTKAKIR